jgi:sec-independent protein translocase protein TatC
VCLRLAIPAALIMISKTPNLLIKSKSQIFPSTVFMLLSFLEVMLIFLFYQIFIFLSAGLYIFEYVYLKTVIIMTVLCWTLSIFVLNNFIFPFSWDFFLKFQEYLSFQSLAFYFEVKLNEYLSFYKSMYYICNVIYQAIIIFFIFLDVFKTNLLIIKKFRKVFYFLFFIFSTFLTPPDVVYQLATGLCIVIIYELVTLFIILRTELTKF